MSTKTSATPTKLAWSMREWRAAVGLGATKTQQLVNENAVASVKVGAKRLITTPPDTFLKRLHESV
ncbi:hypothetical protein [Nitrospirillum viridazoti]|uniref:Excisionase n=1 Tax=Nitrospirillum viridazoti CBAmc TaxID=1441467 RepID=A0A248JRK4_9PROT|nr:hypothetical protein [Nitrospirillum amazonense]ASG21372.1 hypothetical protein Y958_11445 [Nitrospirillum amazonense CBAmc]TWB33048.1 hypothetical protein FBZ91_115110 [Nitrospirillum amazonense]